MRFPHYAATALVLAAALAAMALTRLPAAWIIPTAALLIAAMALAWRQAHRQLRTVRQGIYLIKEQDFASRLRRTGLRDADMVVDLFNRLMDSMKAERLKNREQNLFLAQLIEASPMGIAICDFDGRVIETNPAWRAMESPRLAEALDTLALGQSGTFRLGTAHIYRCSRLWFMDKGFRRPFLLVERLTDEIARAEQEVFRKIIRTMGHEVNNTIGSVASILETMADIHAGEPMVAEALESSRLSCLNLAEFVRGYSDVVKLPEASPVPVDAAAELRRLLPTLRGIAAGCAGEDTEVTLDIADGGAGTALSLDMPLLDRAITNIVKNAAESIATRAAGAPSAGPGRIAIALAGHALTITDNGAGIAHEAAGRLFTPFFSTKRDDRGLGLMLIADVLRSHRATFSLATDPATGLTTFTITFP